MRFDIRTAAAGALCIQIIPALAASPLQPTFEYAFSAHVTLGKPVGPIAVSGGYEIVEPITGGSITGPSFAGQIAAGGSSAIQFNSNFTLAVPFVQIWGIAEDESPFYVTAGGIGAQGSQLARVMVSVDGKYAPLENEFVLATFTDNSASPPTFSTIEAWVVSRQKS